MTTASDLKIENVLGAKDPNIIFEFVLLEPYASTPEGCWPFFRADPVDEFAEQAQVYSQELNCAYKKHGEFGKCSAIARNSMTQSLRACQTCIDMSGDGYYTKRLVDIVNAVAIQEVRPDGTLR